jgi:hypothetical protein
MITFDEDEFEDMIEEPEPVSTQVGDQGLSEMENLEIEVEKRFEIALYYRALLKDTFFDDNNEASKMVEGEVRNFIKTRLETLLGIREKPQAKQIEQFTEEEVTVLKSVASKLIKNSKLLETPTKRSFVQTKKEELRPLVKKRGRPSLRTSTEEKRVVEQKPAQAVIDDIIEENGRKYKIAVNELGTKYKQDITGQQVPNNRMPMPTGSQLELLTHQQAAMQASMAEKMVIEVENNTK